MGRTYADPIFRAALALSAPLAHAAWSAPLAAQPLAARSIEYAGAEASLPGMEAFVDGVVASHMAEHVAGTQVAVVKDGRALLVKGYGIAQRAPERPVDPERTLFRIAAISKTFTWLALMQLADAGRLRLEDDVNKHLPPALRVSRDGWEKPVRVLDLMNHSAGFEERVSLDDRRDETLLKSARQALGARRPARVREPGKVFSYSSYGALLAGAIVTQVSGLDFESYVEQRILVPLGMKHTTFREPYGVGAPRDLPAAMPAELAAQRAAALTWRAGAWQTEPYQHLLPEAPAGAASSCASDMARYMIALLDPAALEIAGVLSKSAGETFRRESFRLAPGLGGIHHGFFNAALGRHCKLGYANLSHGGNLDHFASYLSLVPELALGVFVSTNSASGARLALDVPEQLLRHYFPLKPAPPPVRAAAHVPSEYAGDYRDLRRWYTTLPALFAIDDVHTFTAGANGCLMASLPDAERACFLRIGKDLFEQADGDARIAFVRDAGGQIARVVGAVNAERVRLLDSALWLRAWLAAGLIVTAAVLIGAARGRAAPRSGALGPRLSALCMLLAAVSWLAFYVTGVAWQIGYGADVLRDYPQPLLVFGLRILLVAVSLSVLAGLMLPLILRGAAWSLARRVRYTFALLVMLGLCLALQRWNVIGFHYF